MTKPEIVALRRPNSTPQPPAAPPEPAPADPGRGDSQITPPSEQRRQTARPVKPKPAEVITSATNSQGVVFSLGEKVGIFTGKTAVISGFYKGLGGELYALYQVPDDPEIERGISRVDYLKK
ncbi:MAG: hypothetical protein Fur0025_38280 [Oscillatoriaceae cyanobacterium]